MRILLATCLFFLTLSVWSQEKLLNQCFVLVLDSDVKTDLRVATFDLPFAAMRASKDNEKVIVPHYAFDLETIGGQYDSEKSGLVVKSMRSYEYGEVLEDNEIAFFAMEWPESHRPNGMGPILASFPSMNNEKVVTDHLVFKESFKLADTLVSQLGLSSNMIGPGKFRIVHMEVEF